MAWQALDRRPGRHPRSAPVDDAGDARSTSASGPANEWSPAHRDRPGRPDPRRLRHLPGGQLRRRRSAPAAADGDARPRRSPWPTRRGSRRGRAWRSTRRGGSGSPTRSGPRTGARTPRTSSDGRGLDPLPRQRRAGPLRRRRPAARRPRPGRRGARARSSAMNSFPRLACRPRGADLAGLPPPPGGRLGDNVVVVGGVWIELRHLARAAAAWAPPQSLPRSDGMLDNRPALVVARRRARCWSSTAPTAGSPRGRVDPELDQRYYTQSGRRRRGRQRPLRRGRRPRPRPARADARATRRRSEPRPPSTPTRRPTSPGCAPTAIEAGGQDLPAAPRRVPPPHRDLRGRRQRRRARGHVAVRDRRRRPRLDRQRRPRQRRRQGVHLVADPEDHRPVPQPARVHADVHLRAERRATRTATAT